MSPARPRALLLGAISVAVLLTVCAAFSRSFELDEGYTYLILSGHPRLSWPAGVFTRADIAGWFTGDSPLAEISANLKTYDAHPPVWFYAEELWRRALGPGLVAARLLSVGFMTIGLILTGLVARLCRAPVALSVAFTALAYAILYTGATVRMYPAANALLLLGVWAQLSGRLTATPTRFAWAALAGLAYGVGTATHLFVVFPAMMIGAVIAVALLAERRPAEIAVTIVAALPPVAWAASYYLVQETVDFQFPPFTPRGMLTRIASDLGAALFGGLPLYVPGALRGGVTALLGAVLVASLALAAIGQRRPLLRLPVMVPLVGLLAMPVALFACAAWFGKETVEIRYLIYGIPFLAMFLAGGLTGQRVLPPIVATTLAGLFLAAELAGAVAMPFAAATQQASQLAMDQIARQWQPGALLLLPAASDTSGMTVGFAFEAPDGWSLHLVAPDEPPEALRAVLAGRPKVFLILLADDAGKRSVALARAVLAQAGWRPAGAPGAAATRFGPTWEELLPPT